MRRWESDVRTDPDDRMLRRTAGDVAGLFGCLSLVALGLVAAVLYAVRM